MIDTERGPILGDWRAGANGGNRRAHLFAYPFMTTRKEPACGIRVRASTYIPVSRRRTAELCRDCLDRARMTGGRP